MNRKLRLTLIFRITYFRISLIFILFCCCLNGCDLFEDKISPEDIIISEDVKVIKNQTWNQHLIAIDSTNYTLTFSSDIAANQKIKTGDIIISSIGDGLIRKVISINTINNQFKIQTEFAAITDIIEQGLIEINYPLSISQVQSVNYHYAGVTLFSDDLKGIDNSPLSWNINTVLFDLDGNHSTTGDQLRLEGDFNCDWLLDFKIYIGYKEGLKEAKFIFKSSEELSLKLIGDVQYSFEKEVTLATVNITPFTVMVGIVPVIFTPQIKIIAGIDGSANSSLTTEVSQKLSFEAGVEYNKGQNWSPHKTLTKNLSFHPPELYANASAEVYLKPEIIVKIYGVAGPYANLKLYNRIDADISETPWWELYGGITMKAGARVEILDEFLIDYSISNLLNYEQLLARANTPPVLKPTVTTSNISNISSNSANVGGIVSSSGGADVIERGVYWGTSQNPELTGNKLQIGDGTGIFSQTLNGLQSFTQYYVKAYAVNLVGESIGEPKNFTTLVPDPQSGKIIGIVKDAFTGMPLSNVTIKVYISNEIILSSSSRTDGQYELGLPARTGYKIIFSKSGYLDAEYYNINVLAGGNTILEPILQIDNNFSGNGGISGTLINAIDGSEISGVLLNLRRGINVTTGTIIKSSTSNTSGTYTFSNIPAGNYTVESEKLNFNKAYSTVICLGGQTLYNQDITLSPILNPNETRIILTWGEFPKDLDSHLTGPLDDGSRFHMFYPYSEDNSRSLWPEVVKLDLDDVSSYGPETTTVYKQTEGIYRFSVHDYTNRNSMDSKALSNSGAKVKIYQNSGMVATFNVPPNTGGTLWTVFEMNNNVITSINKMSYEANEDNIQKRDYKNPDLNLFKNLPNK